MCEKATGMVLSYHPVIPGDVNRLCAGREPDENDRRWMQRAAAIILPQGCSESLYRMAVRYCRHVFPDYRMRFLYPGKIGDIRLFRILGFPHPKSHLFHSVKFCPPSFWNDLRYPVVLKSAHGGEGSLVFKVESAEEAMEPLKIFEGMERSGFGGFVVQEFVKNDGRDLRVVVIGRTVKSYWRVQRDPTNFLHNTSHGAVIDRESDPDLQAEGRAWVRALCQRTGINLAGMDLLFRDRSLHQQKNPLFLEINYYFGRKGLGGSERFYTLLEKEARAWLKSLGLSDLQPPPTGGKKATRSFP
ncbi:ATP-grasp domain-containing protein [Desulfosoma caldarium]|uniref:Ribosomal protein S6--L-glutamate ligase n=1 Tax=Desulfosoma caldarium TaxID=610254 RepID=A0A3N1VTP2_9BACT|nr:glutathione synthase [Desulfosoma caldarium]ROR03522.1 ribosomal protein S6--L-glutamate ligase [Desulfosoma caldarium]